MPHVQDVNAVDDSTTVVEDATGLSLRELHEAGLRLDRPILESVLSRMAAEDGETVSPFGSYIS